ncbi:hypothetical protein S40288_09143 [Stachybotrys chartarum IBT 40288]|nr:hypothetical protein S40288_09143 [Stachybotrys chartarum IBT 40288]
MKSLSQLAAGIFAVLIPHVVSVAINSEAFSAANIIQRDVAIIGGGVAGTYAAIRLRDSGKSVVVVEKENQLGGHVNTWMSPTGQPVDYGVTGFANISVVRDFFGRFNIPLGGFGGPPPATVRADFTTGQILPASTVPEPDYAPYIAQLNNYPYLDYGWDLPDPVPEDLLLSFGQFIEKHGIQSAAHSIASYAIGNGNPLEQTAIYVLKSVDRGRFAGAALTPARFDGQELYRLAQRELGSSVLVLSTVVLASRSDRGVELIVQTPGGLRLIRARKLLITAAPTLRNLLPFSLDRRERSLISQFKNNALYVGLLNNTGLAPATRYYNTDSAADGIVTAYNVPMLPAAQNIWATRAPGIYWAWYSSPEELSEAEVRADTIESIQRLAPGSNPNFVAYSSHTPSAVGVSASNIQSGFYRRLQTLQGYKSTWYSGAAWVSDHAGAIWNFTEYEILPNLYN